MTSRTKNTHRKRMDMMKRRLLSIALTLVMCLSLLPVTALAADTITIFPNETPFLEAVRGGQYDKLIWANANYYPKECDWVIDSSSLPAGLSITPDTGTGDEITLRITVGETVSPGEYTFGATATDTEDAGNSATRSFTIVVAEQIGGYFFLPSAGVTITGSGAGGDELPATITLQDGKSAEVWTAGNRSYSSTFTAGASGAKFTYLGSEFHNNQGAEDTIELTSGAVTIAENQSAHVIVNGETYTVSAISGSTATITADGTNGAKISTAGTIYVTMGSNTFEFKAKDEEIAEMTITPGTTGTDVKITNVASVTLDGEPQTVETDDTYNADDLPRRYHLYIEGKQVTSANNKPQTDGGVLPTGVTYDPGTNTLTLTDATIGSQNGAGILYDGTNAATDTLNLVLAGTSTVTAGEAPSGWESAIDISDANLIISGTGTLNASSTRDYGSTQYGNSAIHVTNGNLTINSGIINATANNGTHYNSAIYVAGHVAGTGDITINGGTVNAYANCTVTNGVMTEIGGEIPDSNAAIFLADNNHSIEITGGTVKAYAGKGENNSCGIGGDPGTKVSITGGTVYAQGGSSVDVGSYGIGVTEYVGGNGSKTGGTVTITNATVTAIGGSGTSSYGIGADGNVTISGSSTVTATGSDVTHGNSFGVGTEGDFSISNAATLIATAGSSTDANQDDISSGLGNSYGIGADGDVTISDTAEVTAKGGTAAVMSFGIGSSAGTVSISDVGKLELFGHTRAVGATGTVSQLTPGAGFALIVGPASDDVAVVNSIANDENEYGWKHPDTKYVKTVAAGTPCTVTYDGNTNTDGTAPTDDHVGPYTAGTEVTVLGNTGNLTKTGYTFGGWNTKADGSGTTYQPDSKFRIGADTTFYAVWTANSITPPSNDDYDEPTYRITVEETDNGEVASNRKWAYGGTTITLTVTPEEGYALSALTVTDRRGNEIELTDKGDGVYTFRMPYRDVTVRAAFEYDRWNLGYRDCPRDENCPYWPYTDTDTRAWYHDGVHFCVENGLMIGYGNNLFKPDNSTTRAMITVMLWRLEGSPVVNYLLDFADVPAEAWYTEAIRWAKSEGVAEGYGNGFFGPDDDVTREQMVTILWRYAKYKGHDVSVGEDTNILSYDDAFDVAEYAIPAMQWACGSGMIVGKDDPDGEGMILDPRGVTTRAQMATMMMRFCAEIVK